MLETFLPYLFEVFGSIAALVIAHVYNRATGHRLSEDRLARIRLGAERFAVAAITSDKPLEELKAVGRDYLLATFGESIRAEKIDAPSLDRFLEVAISAERTKR